MELQPNETVPGAPSPAGTASLSPWQRAVAVFARPTGAWSGLESRSQWWFPLVVMMLVGAAQAATLHQRALLPMIMDTWEQAVADGRMTTEQVDRMETFMSGPVGMAMTDIPFLSKLAWLTNMFRSGIWTKPPDQRWIYEVAAPMLQVLKAGQ